MVLWTIPIDVVASSPVPTLSAQSQSALLIGSPGALSLQLEAAEDDPFAHEMCSPLTETVATSEPSKQTSDVTIPLEAKETKRRGRPRKEHKK